MPELPEVEVVRRGLRPRLTGRTIERIRYSNRKLRLPVPKQKLTEWVQGQSIQTIDRRAKYLLLRLENEAVVVIHLGMTGRLGLTPAGLPPRKHDHLRFELDNGRELRFNDVRRFGSVQVLTPADPAESEYFAGLGPEPLGEHFSVAYLLDKAQRRRQPVKNFLMDNRVVVGIGNIYASEILFMAGIDPATPVNRLEDSHCRRLVDAARQVLNRAIDCGGTTINDFLTAEGETGYFQLELAVYGREGQPCRRCSTQILRSRQAGRATFYCPCCQQSPVDPAAV